MSAPINKKLPQLTQDELVAVLKNATYRGFNVNNLATEIEKNGVDKLRYNIVKNQIGLENADGKLKTKIKLNKIHDEMGINHSFSLTRFFKMRVFSSCFDNDAYDARIDRLATELHKKIQEADVKEQAAAKLLSRKDFALMETILKNAGPSNMVQIYDKGSDTLKVVWVQYNQTTQSIEINGDIGERLEFKVGSPVKCLVDGQPTDLDKIPADRVNWLMESFKVAIELSSQYGIKNNKIEISVLRNGVERNPEAHLNQFSEQLEKATKDHPLCNVVYLKDDLEPGQGLDNGGLSRDYLNSMFASLIENSSVSFKTQKKSKLAMPVATQKDALFPRLTPKEQRHLKELGRVMMFCYNSLPNTADFKNYAYTTGQHFDELLFEVALTLKADEAKKNFNDLSELKKFVMAKTIFEKFLKSDKTNSDNDIKDKLALFDLVYWKNGNDITQYNLEAAKIYLDREASKKNDPTRQALLDSIYDEDNLDLKMDGINNNPKAFVDIILQGLLNETYGSTTVAELIAPIHAIANGLHAGCKSDDDWNALKGVGSRKINDKIQGSLDRDAIVLSFYIKTEMIKDGKLVIGIDKEIKELNKKATWLKNWIKNPNTKDEDIRKLLVVMTGCNSLPKDEALYIQADEQNKDIDGTVFYNPLPRGNTCSKTLHLSPVPCGIKDGINDNTEAAFVEMLNEHLVKGKLVVNQD